MAYFLCRIDVDGVPMYCEWSTVIDAPVTTGGTREELYDYYRSRYGEESIGKLEERLARVDATGCSALNGTTVESLIQNNRAGPDETPLTREELIDRYFRNPESAGAVRADAKRQAGEDEPKCRNCGEPANLGDNATAERIKEQWCPACFDCYKQNVVNSAFELKDQETTEE